MLESNAYIIMRSWQANLLAVFILIILSIPALKSLTAPGFYTSHDGETHTARIAQYYQAIKDGQTPPRIAGSFYNYFGSPIFVYIYPLPYIFGSILHFLNFSFVNSFKLIMVFSFVLSQIFTYLWLHAVFRNRKSAFIGALFYGWAPYRFSLIYVRGSISEILAYTFLPVILYLITISKDKKFKLVPLLAISFSLFFLSQNLVVLISGPVIIAYSLLLSFINKDKTVFVQTAYAVLWALAIAAFVFIPTFFERNLVRFDEIIKIAYPSHFVTLGQLFHSPWGYGFDLPGTVNDQLSFQLGLAHILVVALASLTTMFLAIKLKRFDRKLYLPAMFLLVFFVTVFLMLDIKINREIWNKASFLHFIDIPWRLTGISVLCCSFLAAFLVQEIKFGLLTIFLIIALLVFNRNHLRINQSVIHNDQFFLNYISDSTQYGEFTPNFGQKTSPPGDNERVEVLSGQTEFENISNKSNSLSFSANVDSGESQLEVNRYYFPKTEITDNSKVISFQIADPKINKQIKNYGSIILNLTNGRHSVIINFKEDKLRQIADYISLISMISAMTFTIKYAKL